MLASLTPSPGLIYKIIQVHLRFPAPKCLIELLVQANKLGIRYRSNRTHNGLH